MVPDGCAQTLDMMEISPSASAIEASFATPVGRGTARWRAQFLPARNHVELRPRWRLDLARATSLSGVPQAAGGTRLDDVLPAKVGCTRAQLYPRKHDLSP